MVQHSGLYNSLGGALIKALQFSFDQQLKSDSRSKQDQSWSKFGLHAVIQDTQKQFSNHLNFVNLIMKKAGATTLNTTPELHSQSLLLSKSKVLVHTLWIWLREHKWRTQESLTELKVKKKVHFEILMWIPLTDRDIFLFTKIALGRFPILWKSTKK